MIYNGSPWSFTSNGGAVATTHGTLLLLGAGAVLWLALLF